jgi:predicted naringenin-chalcone synthase
MNWLAGRDRATRAKARRILHHAGVDGRHSFLSLEEIFTPCSLTESTRRYREHAVELGIEVLRRGLELAHVEPGEVDMLITTSCTGYMIPSVDAYMAERLGMRSNLLRLPVTEMGCAAGASALIYATHMLQHRPGGVAAVVNIEFPTNTMQLEDFSFDNIVATALFSDGLACCLLRNDGEPGRVAIHDTATHRIFDTTDVLGYRLTDSGLSMHLDESLPEVIAQHFHAAIADLLSRHELNLDDIAHFVVHPGGVKILDRLQSLLDPYGGSVQRSRDVMRRFGNMSSSTVAFILEALLADAPAPGRALLMSFGPGFEAHQLLLQINDGDRP